jgi:hypothetical protein
VPTIAVQALVDTGASDLALDPTLIASLGLLPTDTRLVRTASSGPDGLPVDAFEAGAFLTDAPDLRSSSLEPALAHDLTALGVDALIGRRQLRRLVFTFDGPRNSFTLRRGRGFGEWIRRPG